MQKLVKIGYQASVIPVTASCVVNREHGGWGTLTLLVHFAFELKKISHFPVSRLKTCSPATLNPSFLLPFPWFKASCRTWRRQSGGLGWCPGCSPGSSVCAALAALVAPALVGAPRTLLRKRKKKKRLEQSLRA